MNNFSNAKFSESVATSFLQAVSTEGVNTILESHTEFSDEGNWKPYGGAEKNWDRVGVQTSDRLIMTNSYAEGERSLESMQ